MSINKIELRIDEKARSYAKIYASLINDLYQRKRANAAITALFSYVEYMKRTFNVNIQNSMTLYRNPSLCEQYEIADFYLNKYHIDVRVTTSSKTVLIPKIHYENVIIPDFYVVIKVDTEIKKAEFIGIVDTAATQPEQFDYHYYQVDSDFFISNEEFIARTKNEKIYNFDVKEHDLFKDNYLSFIDNEISPKRKNEILKHLFKCSECRTEFCCFTGFEMVNCNASRYSDLFEDKTLYVIGAQDVDNQKYEGKEEVVYFNDENKIPENNIHYSGNYSSSVMTNEDLVDETKMDFVPSLDEKPNVKNENKEEETDEVIEELLDFGKDNPNITLISGNSEVENVVELQENYSESSPVPDENSNQDNISYNNENTNQTSDADVIFEEIKEETGIQESYENNVQEPEQTEKQNKEEIQQQTQEQDVSDNDILDQLFVDGALEREVQEQQEVAYSDISDKDNVSDEETNVNIEEQIQNEENYEEQQNIEQDEQQITYEEENHSENVNQENFDDNLPFDNNEEENSCDSLEENYIEQESRVDEIKETSEITSEEKTEEIINRNIMNRRKIVKLIFIMKI